MKAEINEATKQKFPALYKQKHEGYVVLFTDFGSGTVVAIPDAGIAYGIGFFSDKWVSCDYEPCWQRLPNDCTVTLAND